MFFFAEAHTQPGLIDIIFDWKLNVLNWLLLVGFLVYGYTKLVPPKLAQREQSINEALSIAERSKQEADELLAQQKARLAEAEAERAKIVEEAKSVAKQLQADLEAQTKREVSDLERKLESAIANERQLIITEVRTAAVKAAMQLSRNYLETNVSEADNKRLLSQFMGELDTLGDGKSYAPGTALGVTGRTE
jgi:F-type H+-transporting ATPase subunit b